jgi:hypothetical protein
MLARDVERPVAAKRAEHPVASPIDASLAIGPPGLVALPLEDPSAPESPTTPGVHGSLEATVSRDDAASAATGRDEPAGKPATDASSSAGSPPKPATPPAEMALTPLPALAPQASPGDAASSSPAAAKSPAPAGPAAAKSPAASGASRKDAATRSDTDDGPAPAAGAGPGAATAVPAVGELAVPPPGALPTAKGMTPVTVPAAAAPADVDVGRTRMLDAVASAVNQGVMQRAATGTVEVPGWGRVAVRAERVGASVDVRVASDDVGTHAVLHEAQGALAADLRKAEIPLGHLRFEHAGAGGAETGSPRDRGAPDDPGRHDANPSDSDMSGAPEAPAASRVRIVL